MAQQTAAAARPQQGAPHAGGAAPAADERAFPPGRARQIITAGLVLAMAVVALETTVVVTALPTIAGELDRLDLYPWVFTAYLLTSTVTVPLYGKLADVYGRRSVFLFGIVLFLIGSVLCGLASGMTQLIVFRALQGLGAGALMPSIFTVVADLYRLQERAKVQGAFSTLWGVTSLVGPGLGAYLTVHWSWRSVFFIGVPFGLAAAIFFICFFKEKVQARQVSLDVAGSVLLMGSLTTLLLALTQGAEGVGWASPWVIGLLVACVVMTVGLIVVERRAPDPVVPLAMFKLRVMSVSSAANFLSGAVLFGVTSYVPLFVQGARGEGAAGAGVALTPMLVAWSMSGFMGPRLLLRFGFRPLAIGATTMIALGMAGLLLVRLDTPSLWLWISMALLGLGFGPSMAAFLMTLQEAVPWRQRGVATSSTQLFRSLGGTIGVALLGSILHVNLMAQVAAAGYDASAISGLLDPAGGGAVEASLRAALGAALQPVFWLTFLCAAATVAMVLVFAREDKLPAPAAGEIVPAALDRSVSGGME
ncbi:MAG: MFS transporter [Chloroflexi bacterium]|nr:MFS transporter [Chloroflexota bacterium]